MSVDIITILIGELLNIVLTVFFVDRIIAWRQKQKWNDAKSMFISYGEARAEEIMLAWKEWLLGMSKVKEIQLDPKNDILLYEMDYYPANAIFMEMLKIKLGDPVGSKLNNIKNIRNRKENSETIKSLVPYLVKVIYSQTNEDWNNLGKNLKNPVDKLSELTGRYSSLVDPQLAASVLRLSIEVENLIQSKYDLKTKKEDFVANLAKASVIGYAINYSMQLCEYLNKNSK